MCVYVLSPSERIRTGCFVFGVSNLSTSRYASLSRFLKTLCFARLGIGAKRYFVDVNRIPPSPRAAWTRCRCFWPLPTSSRETLRVLATLPISSISSWRTFLQYLSSSQGLSCASCVYFKFPVPFFFLHISYRLCYDLALHPNLIRLAGIRSASNFDVFIFRIQSVEQHSATDTLLCLPDKGLEAGAQVDPGPI